MKVWMLESGVEEEESREPREGDLEVQMGLIGNICLGWMLLGKCREGQDEGREGATGMARGCF